MSGGVVQPNLDLPTAPVRARPPAPAWTLPVVVLTAIVCYANSLGNDFTYDDINVIKENQTISGERPRWKIWVEDYWSLAHNVEHDPNPERDLLYRPFTLFTFQLNHLAGGLDPWGYHCVNVLLHAWVSALVVLVSRRLGLSQGLGWLAGMAFAVMPIHVEAVANLVGRAEILASLFTLLSLLWTDRQIRSGTGRSWIGAGAVALFNAAAFLSKEVGIAAYLISLVRLMTIAEGNQRWRCLLRFGVLNGLMGGACLGLRWTALRGQLTQSLVVSEIVNQLHDAAPMQRFWTTWKLLGMHVSKTFYPKVLCYDYSYRAVSLADTPFEPLVLLGLGAGLFMLWAVYHGWRQDRNLLLIAFGWWASYFPVSNSLFLMKTFYAERVWYSPSIFVVLVMAWGLKALVLRHRHAPESPPQAMAAGPHHHFAKVATGLFLFLVVLALMRCWIRNAEWRDNFTLFSAGYRDQPQSTWIATHFGAELLIAGRLAEAEAVLLHALAIHPGSGVARYNLGLTYMRQGRFRDALQHLNTVAMQFPEDETIHLLRQEAALQLQDGESEQLTSAERNYREQPENLSALQAWTDLLVELGRAEDAWSAVMSAQSSFSQSAPYHHLVAITAMMCGRRDEAAAAYQTSLELDPTQGAVAAELAMFYMDRRQPGDMEAAEKWANHAMKVSPNHVAARIAHAELLAALGKMSDAAAAYRALIDGVDKDDPRREQWKQRIDVLLGPG